MLMISPQLQQQKLTQHLMILKVMKIISKFKNILPMDYLINTLRITPNGLKLAVFLKMNSD